MRFDRRTRPGFTLEAEVLTWDLCVFRITQPETGAVAFVSRRGPAVEQFLRRVDEGAEDRPLEALLARPPRRRLRRPPRGPAWPGPHVGIEHELRVLDAEGEQVDVRPILHDLGIDGVRADPGDPNAYRCPWGGTVTCDGREVELATPPLPVRPGFVDRAVRSAELGRAAIESVLPTGLRLEGYSTHLSVSQPRRRDDAVARTFARSYAPGLMLLLDRPTSPGLLVRPRPHRLELCGEYAEGDDLRAALGFATATALAAQQRPAQARALRVAVALEPAQERYGWYVDRRAFGADLYVRGRATPLRRRRAWVDAHAHLLEGWATARPCLSRLADPADLELTDAAVEGRRPLPCERYWGTASIT